MAGIFISYRRSDTEDKAARIADRLTLEFGTRQVFFDKDPHSLVTGAEFGRVIDERVASSDVVLAIMGSGWLVTNEDTDRARLFDDDDFVARELTGAIEGGKPVIPVLVDRQAPPPAAELPDQLRRILDRQAETVRSGVTFSRDVDALAAALRGYLHDDRSWTRRVLDRNRKRIALALKLVFILGVIVFGIVLWRLVNSPGPQPKMDGSFNVAVAELGTVGLDGVTRDEPVGISAGAAVADAIRATSEPTDNVLVWGPDRVGKIPEANGEGPARGRALDTAARLNADVLIYGTARGRGDGRASVDLGIVIRGADERRPTDPLVLEKAFGVTGEVDIRRLDTAQDVLASLPPLRLFGPLVRSVHLLDRDDTASAIAVLEAVRADAERLTPASPSASQIIAAVDGLLGVAFSRQAEAHVDGSLDAATDAFQRALNRDPTFTFAELGLLGSMYLRETGSTTGSLDAIRPDQVGALEALRARYVDIREREVALGTKSVTWAQSSNVIGQIDLIVFEAGGARDARRRASALESFTAVDAAYTDAREPSPELELLANVARSDLGYALAATGDLAASLKWYRAARDIATPYWYAVQSGIIGLLELETGSPCEASSDLARALDGQGEAGQFINGPDRDRLSSDLSSARARCPSGAPGS